jgi:ankyrin repeat protein
MRSRSGRFGILAAGLLLILAGVARVSGLFPARRRVAPVHVGPIETRPSSQALVEAAESGDMAAVRRLLDKGASPDSVFYENSEHTTALEAAAGSGNVEVARLLLDRGADVNAPGDWGSTATFTAAFVGDPEIVRLLISRGGDVNAADDGTRPLACALHQLAACKNLKKRRRYAEVVQLLRAAGARSGWF